MDTASAESLRLAMQGPWLAQAAVGQKRVEGRAGSAAQWEAWVGKQVTLRYANHIIGVAVVAVRHYDTLIEYVFTEGWQAIAPHLESDEEALASHRALHSDADVVVCGGMNALEIQVSSTWRAVTLPGVGVSFQTNPW